MRGIINTTLFFILSVSLIGCDIINPDEPAPAYIHVSSIDLTTDYSKEGAASHKIKDAWVFVDNELVGIYELPAHLPVVEEGHQEVRIQPGIMQNGIAATRVSYPFYKAHDTTVELVPLKTDTFAPTVTYYRDGRFEFAWLEDFESGHTFDSKKGSASMNRTPSNQTKDYLRNWIGEVILNSSTPEYSGSSLDRFSNPNNNREVYLELDYKCTIRFTVGITGDAFGQQSSTHKVTVNPQDEWNKIYIDFTKEVQELSGDFKIFFLASKPDSVSSAELHFDNVKLLHF
jgi:hypothetical protein